MVFVHALASALGFDVGENTHIQAVEVRRRSRKESTEEQRNEKKQLCLECTAI